MSDRDDRRIIARSVPLIDIDIESGGDGRTVTAYAATFDDSYEVADEFGHYFEEIDRAAFNRWLGMHGVTRTVVLFNHGMMPGTHQLSERFALPLGTPLSVTAEPRGLLTRTRYSKTPLADEVLELIRDGAIIAQSFRGPVYGSDPLGPDPVSGLDRWRHTALGLRDYGPARSAVNLGAEFLAVRSIAEQVGVTEDQVSQIATLIRPTSTQETEADHGTSDGQDEGDTDGSISTEPAAPAPSDLTGHVDHLALVQAQRRRRPA
jgi:phage head maturation protease